MLDHRIQTFVTLCETMNYRAAAEQLHITQPAVTQHIQYLEQLYGCRLFVYDGRSLKKTDQARVLLRTACAMHYQEEKLRKAPQWNFSHHRGHKNNRGVRHCRPGGPVSG